MKIILKTSFLNRLANQVEFIALDSPTRARKFKNELFDRIREIPQNPYLYRKSVYFDDTSIRDLIFKGYTIVLKIDVDLITVFGFIKYQHSLHD
jgi:plasmid stabilization system protein ParE